MQFLGELCGSAAAGNAADDCGHRFDSPMTHRTASPFSPDTERSAPVQSERLQSRLGMLGEEL